MPAGCCSPPQQWLHFGSIYVCEALGDPLGRRKTMNILSIFLYFSSTKDILWKNILYRHCNRRNFQTLPYADCSLLWDGVLPQITEVHFPTHTSIANHSTARLFPQQLCVPWIWACKVPPASYALLPSPSLYGTCLVAQHIWQGWEGNLDIWLSRTPITPQLLNSA